MATKTKVIPIPEQIKQALDGRTQRWLSFELRMPEDTFSKKMRGVLQFTNEDIKNINARLLSNIKQNDTK